MANKKDDGRLKVRKDATGEIFTFVQYARDSLILAYNDDGNFVFLCTYDVRVII